MMCQHCAEPPCVDVCPTGASFKRADGIVLVDRHSCIGCRYCMMACPYKARSFVHEPLADQQPDVPRGKGCVESCTLCVHRIDRGERVTACAEACSKAGHGAILFGDLNDPDSEISRRLREVRSTAAARRPAAGPRRSLPKSVMTPCHRTPETRLFWALLAVGAAVTGIGLGAAHHMETTATWPPAWTTRSSGACRTCSRSS
jgi:Fe-S-cluster-containing dehydrogenase component